ncbi:hypothetical protein Msi02_00060 [Microbispora siamensis]|uniref:Uncharacterized protein n=1 Tax=Microbispora siamensis TaxID=564413 RepID=A0ABQ4GCN2_9ACTN|nr:hypothetical protein Msi02_00060 [Microbispora siamensis]
MQQDHDRTAGTSTPDDAAAAAARLEAETAAAVASLRRQAAQLRSTEPHAQAGSSG